MSTKSVLKNKRKKRNRKIRKIVLAGNSPLATAKKLQLKFGLLPAQALQIVKKAKEGANAATLVTTAKKPVQKVNPFFLCS